MSQSVFKQQRNLSLKILYVCSCNFSVVPFFSYTYNAFIIFVEEEKFSSRVVYLVLPSQSFFTTVLNPFTRKNRVSPRRRDLNFWVICHLWNSIFLLCPEYEWLYNRIFYFESSCFHSLFPPRNYIYRLQ